MGRFKPQTAVMNGCLDRAGDVVTILEMCFTTEWLVIQAAKIMKEWKCTNHLKAISVLFLTQVNRHTVEKLIMDLMSFIVRPVNRCVKITTNVLVEVWHNLSTQVLKSLNKLSIINN